MMPVLSSCLKNTFVSQDCLSINWLMKGWSFGDKFPNVSLRGGRWVFGVADLANFWCLARFCGFSPILLLVFGFRQL